MLKRFRLGHAGAADWRTAADACIAQLGVNPGNLGFLYVTDLFAGVLPEIHRYVADRTGVEHWTGTVGIGVCATGMEYLDQPGMVMLAGDFQDGSFCVFGADSATPEIEDLECGGAPASIAVVHGDPLRGDIVQRIQQLALCTETGFLMGGLASSRHGYHFLADGPAAGALSGVAFSDAVTVATRLTQGCSPLRSGHEVSGAQNNIVLELDGRPALDVLREDVGIEENEELSRLGGQIFVGLSVAGSDTSEYVLRNLIGIDPGNRLIAIGDLVKKGQRLRFFRRDHDTARADMGRMLDSIKEGLYTTPRGALYYSCLGRGGALLGGESEELRMIQSALGDVPLAGFFGNGEISHNRLYGYTGVLTLFL